VTAAFPTAHVAYRVRLGAFDPSLADSELTDAQLRALGVFRRYVDALVLEPARVHLVEGKIRSVVGAIEELDLYARLFPLTPAYAAYRPLPLDRHLVWAVRDPVVEAMARERGILVHEYRPAWVDEYLASLRPNERLARGSGSVLPLFGSSPTGEG